MLITLVQLIGLAPARDVAAQDGVAELRAEYARSALTEHGNPAKGQALVLNPQRLACIRCHRISSVGGQIGPDLSSVGGKFAREHLVESVLEPSRQIVEGYRSTLVGLANGTVLAGLVVRETDNSLTMVDGQAQEHVVAKVDIEDRRFSDISIMPEGLGSGLTRTEFVDLIAYLETLRFREPATPGSTTSGSLTLPNGFSPQKVTGGLTAATAMAVAPDGRVFICEQTGALRIVKHGQLLPEPFLTVAVDHNWERGLLGVALALDSAGAGQVYVTYVAAEPYPHHVVSRFEARGDVAGAGSEHVLLVGDDQRTLGGSVPAGHQGGALHFGSDGNLYIAIGEQTAGEPAQRLNTFQGKLLRIVPNGDIPADNPFYTLTQGKYRAIWALGLRNPFTFAVQPVTGRIYVNDVGQNAWEEINEGFAGANYGWPQAEGNAHNHRFHDPVHTYRAASITGGAFCPIGPTGTFPAEYQGRYFFMDFVQGWIKTLDPHHPSDVRLFASGLHRPVDLAFAPDGSLYVLLRDAWVIDDKFQPHTGSLLRIRHALADVGAPSHGSVKARP